MKHKNGRESLAPSRWPTGKKKEAFRRLAGLQEEVFRKVAKNRGLVERSILISREMPCFYPDGVADEKELAKALAAKALGLMQSLTAPERKEFLRVTNGRIFSETSREEWLGLFLDGQKEENREMAKIAITNSILEYGRDAKELFDIYRLICIQDVMPKEESEYNQIYAQPIISGECPAEVMYLRFLDLANEPEKKMSLLASGGEYYRDSEMLELSKTMMNVYYPLADAVGKGTTLAVGIRRNATTILERILHKRVESETHTEEDVRMLETYERCKEYYKYILEYAKRLAENFIANGELGRIVSDLGNRFGMRMELASHTSNPADVYRIKGPSGMFWKIDRYRKKRGRLDYDIHMISDVLATTVVLDGDLEQASAMARRLMWAMKQRFKVLYNVSIKDKPRETGYIVPHLVAGIKVDGEDVPFEVQVRPVEAHAQAKTGPLSHAIKISSGFITMPLVERLGETFQGMETVDTLNMRLRNSEAPCKKAETEAHSITVLGGKKGKNTRMRKDAWRGECAGGVAAMCMHELGAPLSTKFEIAGGDGKTLSLWDPCPQEMVLYLGQGKKVGPDTWKGLLHEKVITPKAREIVSGHCRDSKPKRGLWKK